MTNVLGINLKKAKKEDPAKVLAFLKDLSECEELTEPERTAAKKLLAKFEKGNSVKQSIRSTFSDIKKRLKDTLQDKTQIP